MLKRATVSTAQLLGGIFAVLIAAILILNKNEDDDGMRDFKKNLSSYILQKAVFVPAHELFEKIAPDVKQVCIVQQRNKGLTLRQLLPAKLAADAVKTLTSDSLNKKAELTVLVEYSHGLLVFAGSNIVRAGGYEYAFQIQREKHEKVEIKRCFNPGKAHFIIFTPEWDSPIGHGIELREIQKDEHP